jgi:hypothetical protein
LMEVSQKSNGKLDLKLPTSREEDLALIDRCKELCFTKLSSKYCKIESFISLNNCVSNLVKASEMVRRGTDFDVVKPLLEEWKASQNLR